jgi:hypothetical protein
MMTPDASTLVLAFARAAIELLPTLDPRWEKAYLRFHAAKGVRGASGSYQKLGEVELFDAFEQREIFKLIHQYGGQLRQLLAPEPDCTFVCLLTIDSDLTFGIKYDYDDANKWYISKLDGRTGIPNT